MISFVLEFPGPYRHAPTLLELFSFRVGQGETVMRDEKGKVNFAGLIRGVMGRRFRRAVGRVGFRAEVIVRFLFDEQVLGGRDRSVPGSDKHLPIDNG